MTQPIWFKDLINRLDTDFLEDYEERAAIMQFDGGLSRDHAECLALLNIFRKHPMAQAGLSVVKAELDGDTEFIVTTNKESACQLLSAIGCEITVQNDLASVVDSEFDGTARLAKFAILFEG
ncbi:Rossmann-fold NAD(P)-binding domain-containing protein [Pelobacter propionicus]|uniref:Uncharacterized protein n=1 Tax=Pelobacter propionicus (strain DSM 2379 / NBRC 103807 / OttBd1) TaxID=338966 RepID=A1AUY1_PELPD|nr:hypothetical protein [Pelobacter propionicus]ABL01152.1 hypothetical protein Ppro_3560 [Pelobacter propionicus DSM 2379]